MPSLAGLAPLSPCFPGTAVPGFPIPCLRHWAFANMWLPQDAVRHLARFRDCYPVASPEHFLGGDDRVAVNRYGVLHILRVAAGIGHHHGNVAGAGYAED